MRVRGQDEQGSIVGMTRIRPAVPQDVGVVRAVASSAGERFREVADHRVSRCADDPPPTVDELSAPIGEGRLLVAEDESKVVGFVLITVIDGRAHIDEVSVDGDAQGRGHGLALLAATQEWSEDRGLDGVTLTTFSDVPWNRPYYERRGFVVLDEAGTTPGLRRLIAHEASIGLDPELRVAMHRPRGSSGGVDAG